jgi:lipid II:glycine glycyltransferase (peptidoglycan interpeptide bridge formation enzyme)
MSTDGKGCDVDDLLRQYYNLKDEMELLEAKLQIVTEERDYFRIALKKAMKSSKKKSDAGGSK